MKYADENALLNISITEPPLHPRFSVMQCDVINVTGNAILARLQNYISS